MCAVRVDLHQDHCYTVNLFPTGPPWGSGSTGEGRKHGSPWTNGSSRGQRLQWRPGSSGEWFYSLLAFGQNSNKSLNPGVGQDRVSAPGLKMS